MPTDDDAAAGRQPFAFLSLSGSRFEARGMPAVAATEIAAFAELLYELAREKWLQANPDRARVPPGFREAFDLRLTDVGEGSAEPHLVLERPPVERVSDEEWAEWVDFYESARNGLTAQVAAINDDTVELGEEFTPRVKRSLRKFGATLSAEETATVGSVQDSNDRAELTTARRETIRRLTTAPVAAPPIPVQAEIEGMVVEFDSTQYRFQVRPLEGPIVTCVFTNSNLLLAEEAKAALSPDGINGPDVVVVGKLEQRSSGVSWLVDLDGISIIRSANEKDPMPKFELFADLQDGWLGPDSLRPDADVLALVSDLLQDVNVRRRQPEVSPTPTGGVSFEFVRGQREFTANIEPGPAMRFVVDNLDDDSVEVKAEEPFDRAALIRFINVGEL